jgi:CRP-like cAMP-binding protein
MRYASRGDLIGIGNRRQITGGFAAQALSDSKVATMSPELIDELIRTDITVANAMVDHLADALFGNAARLSDNFLHPLRRRVANHLLDLASRREGGLVVDARVKDIADAVGTTREVMTRILGELRRDGLVERQGRTLVLPDPRRLHEIARGESS